MDPSTNGHTNRQDDASRRIWPDSRAGASSSPALTPSSESGFAHEAKEVLSHVTAQAKDLVASQLAQQTEKSAGELGEVATALRRTSKHLDGNSASPYVKKAAEQIDRASQYIRTADAGEVVLKVETYARREPLMFLGGALALGLIGARFLKSSARHAARATGGLEVHATVQY